MTAAKNFTESVFGGPVRDESKLVSYNGIIAGGFALLAVILRILARLPWFGGTWGLDDWAIIGVMVIYAAYYTRLHWAKADRNSCLCYLLPASR